MFSLPHKHCKHCSVGRSRDSQTKSLILKIKVYRCKFAGKQGLLTTSHVYWPSESSRGRELQWWRDRRYSTLSLLLQTQTTVRHYWRRCRRTLLLSLETKRVLKNSICAEEKTSIILISTKLPAHSNAGLCQFWTNYADVNIKRRCHKHNI